MPDYLRTYAKQEYLTPAAAETVELIAEAVRPDADALLLEVAAGKAEAACTLAGRFACPGPARALVPAPAARAPPLPLRGAACDAAYCIGAPSIVGLEPCLTEMARAVRPGGHVVVSDIVLRRKPGAGLGPE